MVSATKIYVFIPHQPIEFFRVRFDREFNSGQNGVLPQLICPLPDSMAILIAIHAAKTKKYPGLSSPTLKQIITTEEIKPKDAARL